MMNHQIERQILERKVHDCDQRLAELELVEQTVDPHSYRGQELASERIDLRRICDVAAGKLRDLAAPPGSEPAPASIENAIADRRETSLAFIGKLEDQGNHQQAKIWRLALLDLSQQVLKEFS